MKLTPDKGGPRINEGIDTPNIQLIDATGNNVGVVAIADALARAVEAGLDLVEISPNSEPPVCKILDFGKYKYQAQKKAAEARKKQRTVEIKEIKMRPNIDIHDYEVKMRSIVRLLRGRRQGQGHLALPRPRDGAYGARHQAARPGEAGHRDHRQGGIGAPARRPADGDGAGAALAHFWLALTGFLALRPIHSYKARLLGAARQGMPWRLRMLSTIELKPPAPVDRARGPP